MVIGVGIIGLSASGGWAAGAHVPALAAVDGYELVAASASSPESARAAADQHDVPHACADATELIHHDAVDLVVVAVKAPNHAELVEPALRAGKMVLCEWPLGAGRAETEALADVAAARGVRTLVGLQARSAPAIRYLHDLIGDGYVGEVLSTSLIAHGNAWGPRFAPGEEYLLDPAGGATMLTVAFGHTVDALTLVLGEFTDLCATTATRRPVVHNTVTGAAAAMTSADQVAVSGVLDSGAVASLHFRGGQSRGTQFHWEINGTDGDLIVTQTAGMIQVGAITLRGARGADRDLAPIPVPPAYERVPSLSGQTAAPAYNVAHAYVEFRDDLAQDTHTTPDFAHAADRHRLLDRVHPHA